MLNDPRIVRLWAIEEPDWQGTNFLQAGKGEEQCNMLKEETMSERLDDPKFEDYTWVDDVNTTLGPVQLNDSWQGGQPDYPNHPKPIFDYPSWTPGQRDVNSRMQHLFRGNVYDSIAPSFSERFKPGFDPNSIPHSANGPLSGPGMKTALDRAGIVGLGPFSIMGKAEDIAEQALGKQIWHRESPEEKEKWWLENHD